MELPRTLHGQLFLLAYDRNRRRFDYGSDSGRKFQWRFEFALRSAMLTDLYLTGYIENKDGEAALVKAHHDDPLLQKALDHSAGRGWSQLIYRGGRTCQDVFDQLETVGWIRGQPRKMLGLVAARPDVYDEDMVDLLAAHVTEALRNILADRPADPRALAIGLIAVQALMPFVDLFTADKKDRDSLHEMTLAAIEPILGLFNADTTQSSDGVVESESESEMSRTLVAERVIKTMTAPRRTWALWTISAGFRT